MAAKLTAVLGNCKRTGRWKIRSHTKALVLFGNCKIDYRDAYADDDLEEIKLDVLCLFGRAVFILPPGANVQPSAVSLLSSSKFDVKVTTDTSDLPSITMETTTIFGMCRVQTIEKENAWSALPPPLPSHALLNLPADGELPTTTVPALLPTEIAIGDARQSVPAGVRDVVA